MKYRSLISLLILLLLGNSFCLASDKNASHKSTVTIPEVALLSLQFEGNPGVQMTATAPTMAGTPLNLENHSNTTVWLNYSSVTAPDQKRKVTAMVVGEIPEGVTIKLNADESTGQGKGKLGKSNGKITLSNIPGDIISDIGSCYTGRGIQNGHKLSYSVEIDNAHFYKSIKAVETSLSVVYTLTDDN